MEKPLSEQEQRYLNALKLFMARGEDPQHLEHARILDALSPEQARHMIATYHLGLDDPQVFFLAYKLYGWISPILYLWEHIKDIFRCKPRA